MRAVEFELAREISVPLGDASGQAPTISRATREEWSTPRRIAPKIRGSGEVSRIRTQERVGSHKHRPITACPARGNGVPGPTSHCLSRSERLNSTPAPRPKPLTRIVEQNSSYNQLLTARDHLQLPNSPVCHNRAAMRTPSRIPVNGATSPTASATGKPHPPKPSPRSFKLKTKKSVFSIRPPNFRSDKCQSNLNLARRLTACRPVAPHSANPENGKIKKNSRNEVNPTSDIYEDKYGANPASPAASQPAAGLTRSTGNDIVFDSYSEAGE